MLPTGNYTVYPDTLTTRQLFFWITNLTEMLNLAKNALVKYKKVHEDREKHLQNMLQKRLDQELEEKS